MAIQAAEEFERQELWSLAQTQINAIQSTCQSDLGPTAVLQNCRLIFQADGDVAAQACYSALAQNAPNDEAKALAMFHAGSLSIDHSSPMVILQSLQDIILHYPGTLGAQRALRYISGWYRINQGPAMQEKFLLEVTDKLSLLKNSPANQAEIQNLCLESLLTAVRVQCFDLKNYPAALKTLEQAQTLAQGQIRWLEQIDYWQKRLHQSGVT